MSDMRGYFAIGIEGVSKAGNIGNLMRTAHGFGAAFVFAIGSRIGEGGRKVRSPAKAFSDTARTADQVPFWEYDSLDELTLPHGCRLVGVELDDGAVDLPSFRHPPKAAYILGSERYSLSAGVRARCDHVIKIPTRFSLNVATAGAIVMYDRLLCHGRFAERPVGTGQEPASPPEHVRGQPKARRRTE